MERTERQNMEMHLGSLLEMSQAGDSVAYATFLKETQFIVRRYVGVHWFDKNTVDDVVQSILFSIHKAKHTYNPSLTFYPWLFSISKCKLIDELRKVQRQKRVKVKVSENLNDFLNICHSQNLNPESDVIANEKSDAFLQIEGALKSIPNRQREAVLLLKCEEKSVKEASNLMGISEGAFKVLAHRGYEALRKLMNGGVR